MKVIIKQNKFALSTTIVDALDQLVMIIPTANWPDLPYKEVIKRRAQRLSGDDAPFTTELPNARDTRLSLGRVNKDISAYELLSLARKLVIPLFEAAPTRLAIAVPGLSPALAARVVEALVAAALAHAYPLPAFKSKAKKKTLLKRIDIYGVEENPGLARTLAEAQGNGLARELAILPPNELTPGRYRARIAKLAKEQGWKMKFHDLKALGKLKAGAFLAVARASANQDDGIVQLRYEPTKKSKKPALALVGKGICFDTGGHNLKPARHMHGMHEDMAGSAVALGTLLALSQLKVDFPVDCWLALAENMISPQAYKQNEVVTALDGTTIEIIHTDAEGRMVLADTLVMASRAQPGLIIDYATLTGACVYALGTAYAGAFTNRPEWLSTLIQSGMDSGERVWPFPMDSDYDQAIDSHIADVKQCTLEGDADHILAARFLQRFVDKKIPWLHLDLACASRKGGLAHIPSDSTGFGVRYTLDLVLDKKVVKN